MKGKIAVERAIDYLKKLGFITSEAQNENANGHDIIAIKNGRGYTFEVKPAVFKNRSYKVSPVVKRDSDGIIIVFKNGSLIFNSMEEHLNLCSKSGYRHLTFVGKIYE